MKQNLTPMVDEVPKLEPCPIFDKRLAKEPPFFLDAAPPSLLATPARLPFAGALAPGANGETLRPAASPAIPAKPPIWRKMGLK